MHTRMHTHRLYKSLGDFDSLRGIFSSQIGTKSITKEAMDAEERGDYLEAVHLYKQVCADFYFYSKVSNEFF